MKKLFIVLMILSILPGCIPVAFVAGATAGGAIVYDKRNLKTMMHDREIANRAQAKINNSAALRNAHVSVASFNRIVLIIGQTPTPRQRALAYELVSSVPGIKRIYNRLTMAAPSSSLARANDAWITSKVKTMMLAKSGLHSTQIKVITENGVVYLMGVVGRKQAQLATNVARRVDGVQEVVKVFEYA